MSARDQAAASTGFTEWIDTLLCSLVLIVFVAAPFVLVGFWVWG